MQFQTEIARGDKLPKARCTGSGRVARICLCCHAGKERRYARADCGKGKGVETRTVYCIRKEYML